MVPVYIGGALSVTHGCQQTAIAAPVGIQFVCGCNPYLWPLLMTTHPKMMTAVIGLQDLIPAANDVTYWHVALAVSLLAMLPPTLVVLLQRWLVKGLVEKET